MSTKRSGDINGKAMNIIRLESEKSSFVSFPRGRSTFVFDKKILKNLEKSDFFKLRQSVKWRSYAGYFGDQDEGDFVNEEGEIVTEEVIQKAREYGITLSPYDMSFLRNIYRTQAKYEAISNGSYMGEDIDKFMNLRRWSILSKKPNKHKSTSANDDWRYLKNLNGEDVFCLLGVYQPEGTLITIKELIENY